KRTEPQEIPGVEAMMPSSPTVKMLNRPDITLAADLHVLGGDIKPSGVWHRLKVFVTDLYYQEDHDLVVNTKAMLGGADRVGTVHYWVDEGAKVNHFLYFSNGTTVSRLEAALVSDSNAAFRPLKVAPSQVERKDYVKRSGEPQPIVFVLPGIMGSHLTCQGKRIWLDYIQLARGGVTKLTQQAPGSEPDPNPDVLPDGPVEEAYGELMVHLARNHDVRPFAYDWRNPIEHTADLLEAQLRVALDTAESNNQPIRIVAHSMGGLVFRALIATDSGNQLWKRMCRLPGCRFMMLGTPNGGSHAMASLLIGRDSLLKKLAWLDLKNNYAELQETVVEFDGVLQLLPHSGSLNLFDPDDWDRLYKMDIGDRIERKDQRGIFGSKVASSKSAGIDWKRPDVQRLENAARLQQLLSNSPIEPQYMVYIAGTAAATAVDISIDEHAVAGRKVRVSATAEGDGRVPWEGGIPVALKADNTYYLNAAHGDLAAHSDAFPGIIELLVEGRTDKLSKSPPSRRGRTATQEPILLPESVDMYPDRQALLCAALGGEFEKRESQGEKVRVRIIHGNLARAEHPVIVGHYDGDTIVSAEDYLDRQLNGRLRERHRLGLYPAKLGTNTVVLSNNQHHREGAHPGAIVVGLGTFGDLTPGRVTATMAQGLMQYVVTVLERTRERYSAPGQAMPAEVNISFSALLIGASSDIGVTDSLRSILQAVNQVNQQLRGLSSITDEKSNGQPLTAVFSQLDIIELWEDKAVQATRALKSMSTRHDLSGQFEFETRLVEQLDGCTRSSVDDHKGWSQRMRVTSDLNGVLQYETFAEQARIDTYLQPTQQKLVDRLLSYTVGSVSSDASLSCTLFDLLIPNQLKEYAPDRRDMVLMLDKISATYPWELLQDRSDADDKPLSVQSVMIRQLVTDEFRAQPVLAQTSSALVIGDPEGNKSTDVFPSLLGARKEARQVARLLNARGYSPVVELNGDEATALRVLTSLYDQPYKVLHIAAHGVFEQPVDDQCEPIFPGSAAYAGIDETTPRITGVVLGDGMYLTPVEIEQMQPVPQLVFVNCCHLGNQDAGQAGHHVQYNKLAASFSQALIKM
ncbi:CHAT domain-containing protein, partial [Granulosicoccus sp.]|nr:CHAT domain-containing protein [Granulosicoccus sp.]